MGAKISHGSMCELLPTMYVNMYDYNYIPFSYEFYLFNAMHPIFFRPDLSPYGPSRHLTRRPRASPASPA